MYWNYYCLFRVFLINDFIVLKKLLEWLLRFCATLSENRFFSIIFSQLIPDFIELFLVFISFVYLIKKLE